jgi:glyoxylase I family protein
VGWLCLDRREPPETGGDIVPGEVAGSSIRSNCPCGGFGCFRALTNLLKANPPHDQPNKKMSERKVLFRPVAVRYQVKDVDRSVAFYTEHLGFKLDRKAGPVGLVSIGGFQVWLSGPGSSGSRPMADGGTQEPGGWNRLALEVDDLSSVITEMKNAGLHFRNEMEEGPGGKQIQLEDPDGNPIELFEPAH